MADTAINLGSNQCSFPDCNETDAKICVKCQKSYCAWHASKVSPNFCADHFDALSVIIEKYVKKTEEYNEITDQVEIDEHVAKRYRLDGPDYVWYSIKLNELTDEEIKVTLQFHKFIVSLLEHIDTVRKVKKSQLLKNQPTPSVTTTEQTSVKKQRVVKVKKPLRDLLIAQGIKEPLLTQMLKAAGEIQ